MLNKKHYRCQIIGAGPAGISLIIALYNLLATAQGERYRELQALLDSSLLIEAGRPGGLLSSYQINANTDTVDVVKGISDGSPFVEIRDQFLRLPETQNPLIALPRLDQLLLQPLVKKLFELMAQRIICNQPVKRIIRDQGLFTSFNRKGEIVARSENLVLCCGGREQLLSELKPWQDKTLFAGDFLRFTDITALPHKPGPIVIVGASHSGFSCAWRLLNDGLFADFAASREIVILQRRQKIKLRCRPDFAKQYGIEWDKEQDVCPKTGIIFRNAGLRKDAKFLYLNIRDGEEKRVRIQTINRIDDQSELLEKATLVIQASGFIARLPQIEVNGSQCKIDFKSKLGEVRDADSGEVIEGLFANGLGMHILPDGEFRGEKSFNGSIDGMLSYPLAISPHIIERMIDDRLQ